MLSKINPLAPKLAFIARGAAAATIRGRVGGDISPVFPSSSGIEPPPLPDRYAELKGLFTAGRERILVESWERSLLDLGKETAVVKMSESDFCLSLFLLFRVFLKESRAWERGCVILQAEFRDPASPSKEEMAEIKERGSVVLKNFLLDKEALVMKGSLKAHIGRNAWAQAFPAHSPAVYELYWSPDQRVARANPSLVASQCFVNSLWHSSLTWSPVDTSVVLPYPDCFRICQPSNAGFALGAHNDGGSEEYDSYNADHRFCAKIGLYDRAGSCGVQRSWQHWLSLSIMSPGERTLLASPLLKHTTAYTILRPFFTLSDPPTLTTVPHFPNCFQSTCQECSTTHPHLLSDDAMTQVPRILRGDYVF
ncbi:unnamed protein product [Tuber aestivum]|uniref:Uncharacterized protein n=1 Tax=Tuber aestivum TaxID=59557 RepID=A0A292PXP6_9PEZI|nr:unnamed protein product [Tuber aestivum]